MDKDVKSLVTFVWKWTLISATLCACLGAFLWPGQAFQIVLGVYTGAFMALGGIGLITRMTTSLVQENRKGRNVKVTAFGQWVIRYFLYGVCMVLAYLAGAPILAILVGFMCSRLALLAHSFSQRKENP